MKLKSDYRISEELVTGVIKAKRLDAAMEGVNNAFMSCPKSQRSVFLRRLTTGQRAVALLGWLDAEICNGGLYQYFWNSTGDDAEAALEGLKAIRARKHETILGKVIHCFRSESVLRNRRLRRTALKRMPRNAFKNFDESFYELNCNGSTSLQQLVRNYFEAHPEDFFLLKDRISIPGKVVTKDYRVSWRMAESLRGEKLHRALVSTIWDDYWAALKTGRVEAEALIETLSRGQRALVAIDIFDKIVLHSGFGDVMSFYFCPDLLIREVSTGYRLLRAQPYLDLFGRVVKVSGEIPAMTRRMSEVATKKAEIKLRFGDEAAKPLGSDYMKLFKSRRKLARQITGDWQKLREEFNALIKSRTTRIEAFIEAYVDAQPEEFFRDRKSSKVLP